jgi:DNA-binding transcriptional LysR family regulator
LRALLGAADNLRAAVTAFDPVQSDRAFSLLLTDVGMIRFLPPLIAQFAAIMLQVPSFIAGAIVAAETDALATLPANLAKRLAGPLGLTAFETPISLPRIEISQYWHERYHRDAAHRWFRSATFDLFGATTRTRGPADRVKSPPPRTTPR